MKKHPNCSQPENNEAKIEILVEDYPNVSPKFTKLNWIGGEGDDNA
jgi:hypothetical protein